MILFVCTGNICRSPMGEALLRHHLTAAGADRPVASAGTHAMDGGPATGHGIEVLADRDIDLTGHRSRHLDAEVIDGADLIVAMTRRHEAAVARLDPTARGRTFLVGEVVRLGGQVGPPAADEGLRAWATRLDAARGGHMTTGRVADEVADPYGENRTAYEQTANRLEGPCSALARLLSPAA
jgi:protein-tyrosine phosphatase